MDESSEHFAYVLVCAYLKQVDGSIIMDIQIMYHYL
jgi:hypothetical protein